MVITTAAIRSEAASWGRLTEFGLGINTIGVFATCCGYSPEDVTDAEMIDAVVKPLAGWDSGKPAHVHLNNFRQLNWDCVQAFLADTRTRYDPRPTRIPSSVP